MTAHGIITANAARSPFLLVSRVGRGSLHAQWLSCPRPRGFDLLLSSYDDVAEPAAEWGLFFEYRPGTKVAGYGEILRDHAALISQYGYVALFDDDLEVDEATLLALFRLVEEQGLKIAQPALDHASYFTSACLLRHHGYVLRHVDFIEMMCPIFRTDVLLAVAPLFDLGFESGIDLVWSALVRTSPRDMAVIDCLPVRHTRPVGATKSLNGFRDGRIYESDIHAILRRFKLDWTPPLPTGGLRVDGRYTNSRLNLWLSALGLVAAIPIRSYRFRAVAMVKYWRQLLLKRPRSAVISHYGLSSLGGTVDMLNCPPDGLTLTT